MARDSEAREKSKLDRRSYVKLAGAAMTSIVGTGAVSGTGLAADYETIEVPAGQTKVFNVGAGETFENKLIDCTASGAAVLIRASGDGWTVRNIGVKGAMPTDFDAKLFVPQVPSGGSALVENVYWGDGLVDNESRRTMDGAVWVSSNHRGTVTFRNVYIEDFSTGIYGSGQGYQLGSAGGDVRIENSFVKDCNIAGFRISGDGSYIKDSTIAQVGTVNMAPNGVRNARGIWLKDDGDMVVENCDIDVSGPYGTQAVVASHGASGVVRNCRVTGGPLTDVRTENISDNPSREPPAGCPRTAEEAAAGISDGGSDTTTPSGSDEDDAPESGTLLELVAVEGTSNVEYEFTVEGSVQKRTDPSGSNQVVAEDNDSITDNGDGTYTVTGVSGNGYGDAFYVDGAIASMDLNEDDWIVRYDGEEVAVEDVVLPKKLVVDGSNRPRAATTYTFEVSGTARKSGALGSVNAYDEITDGKISGRVVGGKDGFRFSGEVTGFSIDGPARVRVEDGP